MAQIIGILLTLLGSAGVGAALCTELAERRKELQFLIRTFTVLTNEVSYGRQPLPACCRHTGEKVGGKFGGMLRDAAGRMEESSGLEFAQAWRQAVEGYRKGTALKRQDLELLASFPSYTGFLDEAMQVRAMEQFEEVLSELAAQAKKEEAEKGKLRFALCTSMGIVMILLLV